MENFDQVVHTNLFLHSPAIGMQNGGESLPRFVLARQCLLVKLLITLKQHGISTRHRYAKTFSDLYRLALFGMNI